MTTGPHLDEEAVFKLACKITDMEARAAYLQQVCGQNQALCDRVLQLLKVHADEPGFLEAPPSGVDATQDMSEMRERVGEQIGPYKLLQVIGEGGMGVVYMAEQLEPIKRRVALKIIKPGMDSRQVIARFEVERQALAMMDHQNIAKVLEAGTTQSGRPYFVMELVHGVPFTKFCDDRRLTPRERLELFVPVCQAIQHAHQKGIIHRDIKPSNILVTMYDDKPVPKVIDFGVAKAVEQRLTDRTLFTQYGTLVGTFEYMSPEQAEMNAFGVDTRSDIYSLGVLLYELLTGTTPLERHKLQQAALVELVRLIKEEEPPRPSIRLSSTSTLPKFAAACRTEPTRLSRLLRGEIDWIVMKCLEKDRTRRYETANALAADVSRYLQDEPVTACPPSFQYRVFKFTRRYKAPLTVAAALIVLLIGGIVASTWQAVRARNAETLAVANERKALLAAEALKKANEAEAEQRRLAEESAHTAVRERNSTLAAKEELRETLYASEMNLVQAAVESHQYARAMQLLEQQRPTPGQRDLRGFEWDYWRRWLKRGQLRSLEIPQLALGGSSPDATRFFSRDAARLVTQVDSPSDSRTKAPFGLLAIFDTTTGHELLAPFDPFPDTEDVETRTPHVAVSDDGTRLATTLSRRVGDGRPAAHISIYDASTAAGKEIRRIESPGNVWELALTTDGSRLAATYLEQQALTGDLPRNGGGNPAEILRQREELITRQQAAVKIWDISTGELIQTLPKLPWTFRSSRILWSPDGTRLLRQSVGKEIIDGKLTNRELFQVVDVASGAKVWEREFPSHAIPRRAWTWSPDGKLVVIFEVAESGIAAKHNAQLWDSDTGKTLAILDRNNPSNGSRPGTIDFSPDGRRLAVGSGANEIYVWELPNLIPSNGSDPFHIAAPDLTFHTTDDDLHAVAFSADGHQLHSVAGTSLATWDATLREDVGVGPDSLGEYFISAISADATKVAFSAASLRPLTSCLWDLTNNREVFRLPMGTTFSRPGFSADGRRMAVVRTTNASPWASEIVTCDTQTGEVLSTFRLDQNRLSSETSLASPVLRPDGGQIAALLQPFRRQSLQEHTPALTRLIAWDTATGQQAFSTPIDATFVTGLAYSQDGSSLVVGANSRGEMAAVFYDASTGERQRAVKMPGTPRSAVLILARHQIFADFVGVDALFSDLETGQERFRLAGHHDLEDAAISPDGSRLAVGRPLSLGGESEVTLWSLKTGRRLLALKRSGRMESIAFSPDGNRLVATFRHTVPGAGKPIQVWDATPLPKEVSR